VDGLAAAGKSNISRSRVFPACKVGHRRRRGEDSDQPRYRGRLDLTPELTRRAASPLATPKGWPLPSGRQNKRASVSQAGASCYPCQPVSGEQLFALRARRENDRSLRLPWRTRVHLRTASHWLVKSRTHGDLDCRAA
jgi:hypothetical protein